MTAPHTQQSDGSVPPDTSSDRGLSAASEDRSVPAPGVEMGGAETGDNQSSAGQLNGAGQQASTAQDPPADDLLRYLVPLGVYMACGSFEPAPSDLLLDLQHKGEGVGLYPILYAIKIVLTMAALGWALPVLLKLPARPRWSSLLVGIVGAVIWITLSEFVRLTSIQETFGPLFKPLLPMLKSMGLVSGRPGFNPWTIWANGDVQLYAFLALRFTGLALIVPIVEETFLRGFVMRYFANSEFDRVGFKNLPAAALLAGTIVPMFMHPALEWPAVIAWFSLVTWWMLRTGSFWDCVVVHGVTNFVLGLYVVFAKAWHLW